MVLDETIAKIESSDFKIGIAPILNINKDRSILSEREREELKKINHPERIESWWKARQILSVISKETGIDYMGLRKGSNGKPHFIKGTKFHCSLSHSDSHASAMISKASCGIDIERVDPKVERIFSKFSEPSELEGKKETKYKTAIWACKESIYKALDIPGIHFREQIRLKEWNDQGARFNYASPDGWNADFDCTIEWFDDHVLAFTLHKYIQQ